MATVQQDMESRLNTLKSFMASQDGAQTSYDAAAQQAAAESSYASRFAELLSSNDAYRAQQSEAWEKREKEGKARKTFAAISDALSSLGNLIGTTNNASNQVQTYQMPFVQQDLEKERTLARATAERIRATEQSLRNAEASRASSSPLALENLRHQHTMEQIKARGDVNSTLEEQKQIGRVALKNMYYAYKGDYDKMMAELRREGLEISRERLAELIRSNMANEELKREGGSGNVGEYTTTEKVTYDDYGRIASKTRQRKRGDGTTTTTTTTSGGSSENKDKKEAEKEQAPAKKEGGFNRGKTENKEKKEEEKKGKKGGFKTK